MKNTLRSQKGFSLIELMIVVAIIGILSAIAVPNYQRFQRKAKQTEARTLLSMYYTAAKASMAEYSYNYGSFPNIGYKPEGQINYRVTSALSSTATHTAYPNVANDDACIVTSNDCQAGNADTYGNGVAWTETAAVVAPATTAVTNDGLSFVIVASSNVLAGTVPDEWSVDQMKTISNAVRGFDD